MVLVMGNSFRVKLQRLYNADGKVSVCPQVKLRIIKIIKIINRIGRSIRDVFDFLQIDEINLLLIRSAAAETDPLEGFSEAVLQLPVEHGRGGTGVHLIIAGLR